jgi:hypothetical protein
VIITRLRGGLGNQLFQFAAGLNLARHHSVSVTVDCSYYAAGVSEIFELLPGVNRAKCDEVAEIIGYQRGVLSLRSAAKRLFPSRRHVRPARPGYSIDLHRLGPDSYLDGYWQSY